MQRPREDDDEDGPNKRQRIRTGPLEVSSRLHRLLFDIVLSLTPAFLFGCRGVNINALIETLLRTASNLPEVGELGLLGCELERAFNFEHARIVTPAGGSAWHSALSACELTALQVAINQVQTDISEDYTIEASGDRSAQTPYEVRWLNVYGVYDLDDKIDIANDDDDFTVSRESIEADILRLSEYPLFSKLLEELHAGGATHDDAIKLITMSLSLLLRLKRDTAGQNQISRRSHPIDQPAPNPKRGVLEPFARSELLVIRQLADHFLHPSAEGTRPSPSEAALRVPEPLRAYFISRLLLEEDEQIVAGTTNAGVPGVFVLDSGVAAEVQGSLEQAVAAFVRSLPEDTDPPASPSPHSSRTRKLVDPRLDAPRKDRLALPSGLPGRTAGAMFTLTRVAKEMLSSRASCGERSPSSTKMDAPYLGSLEDVRWQTIHGVTGLFGKAVDRERGYHLLPAELTVDQSGSKVSLLSYIHGLSPFNELSKPLYPLIESVLSAMVPLFEAALTELPLTGDSLLTEIYQELRRIDKPSDWYSYSLDNFDRRVEHVRERHRLSQPQQEPPSMRALVEEALAESRVFRGPRPQSYMRDGDLPFIDFKGRTLQMIVKLEHIDVDPSPSETQQTPDWADDIVDTEQICAIGYHYFDFDNVASVDHDFALTLDGSGDYICKHVLRPGYPHYAELYGFERGSIEARQDLGSLSFHPGMNSFAFPNTFLRHEPTYKLHDPTRPGSVRRLVFWMVDPSRMQLSTARVMPPQVSWLRDATKPLWTDSSSRLSRLPLELLQTIFDELEAIVESDEESGLRPSNYLVSRRRAQRELEENNATATRTRVESLYNFDGLTGRITVPG